MNIYNLTPHDIFIYKEEQFINLKQINENTLVADKVIGSPIRVYLKTGTILRIKIENVNSVLFFDKVVPVNISKYIELEFKTQEGKEKITEETIGENDFFLVSQKMLNHAKEVQHPLSFRMYCPYKVVRNVSDLNEVFGCISVSR